MNDERARILKLLEDGKITADQAARLIEALKPRSFEPGFIPPVPPLPPLSRRRHMKELERIPDIVAHAVTSAMKSGIETDDEGKQVFPGKTTLSVKGVSGDVEVNGSSEDRIVVSYSGGMVKVREADDGVEVRSVSGDVEADVPNSCRLDVTTVSGDVTVGQVNAEIQVKTVSGDVQLEDHDGRTEISTTSGDVELNGQAGETRVETRSGDTEIEMAGPLEGSVLSRSGDITLAVCAGADLMIEAEAVEDGEVELDVTAPHEVLEQRAGLVRVKFGEGSRSVVLRTRSGEIAVRDAEEA